MSYNPMLGNNSMNMRNYNNNNVQYDPTSSYKMIPPQNYNSYTPSSIYPQTQTSIALFHIPNDATNSLYVDGIPSDATERQVSHIFRPFPGYQCIRLIKKTTSTGRDYFLCFVDFQNILQSTIAMNTLQGYRFDHHDHIGLKISFAKESKEVNKEKSKRYK